MTNLPPGATNPGWALARLDGELVTADARFAALLGVGDPSTLSRRRWPEMLAEPAEAVPALQGAAEGRAWSGVLRFVEGTRSRWLRVALTPPAGGATGVVVLALDEAQPPHGSEEDVDRMLARDGARIAALEAVAELAAVEAAARAVLQALAAAVPFEWGAVLRLGGERASAVAVYPSAMAGVGAGRAWSPPGAAEQAVLERAEPSLGSEADIEGDPSPLARIAAFGLHSVLRVPLFSGSAVVGAAVLYRAEPYAFTPQDGLRAEALLRALGRRVGELPAGAPPEPAAAPSPVESPVEAEAPRPPVEEPVPTVEQPVPPVEAAGPSSEPQSPEAMRLTAIGDFVAEVAHELNSPLTAIAGYARLLPSLPEGQQASALQTIEQEALRVGRLVRDLLTVARPQPRGREAVDLDAVVERTAALRRDELAEAQIELELDLGGPVVLGDEYQVEAVLFHLLSHAEHQLAPQPGRVVVETSGDASTARLAVAYEGAGAEPGADEPRGGPGLGLLIAQGIVEEHGGRLLVEPAETGARLVAEFPAAQSSPAVAPAPVSEEPPALEPPSPTDEPAAPTEAVVADAPPPLARVLLVEAEDPMRGLLVEILEEAGYAVDTASEADAPPAGGEDGRSDVMLVDLHTAAAERYRPLIERARIFDMPAVLVADYQRGEELEAIAGDAPVWVLEKPFDRVALVAALEAALVPRAPGGR